MKGTGERLNRIFGENSLAAKLVGVGYSIVITIAPMLIIIGTIFLLQTGFGFRTLEYSTRVLFSSTVMYIFMFSLLITTPVSVVVGKYVSDMVYLEQYDEIMPCFYTCLGISQIAAFLMGIPFGIHEYMVGGVDALIVLLSYFGFNAAVFMTYTMSFLNICRDYLRVALYYCTGMGLTLLTAFLLTDVWHLSIVPSLLLALDTGLLVTAACGFAQVRQYFPDNSGNYRKVLSYFGKYLPALLSSTLYIVGLYVHNFVFWGSDLRVVAADSFVSADVYDMAAFLGLLTNISATVIFITDVERNFRDKYGTLMESITGGRLEDIVLNKQRVFRQTRQTLTGLIRRQFVFCVVVYLLFVVFMPQLGISSFVMQIYPCLAAGYFVMFAVYAILILMNYFSDNMGSLWTSLIFFGVTLVVSLFARDLSDIWYGIGLFAGSFTAWTFGFFRLRWFEMHFDERTFCQGDIIEHGSGRMPDSVVFVRGAEKNKYSGMRAT